MRNELCAALAVTLVTRRRPEPHQASRSFHDLDNFDRHPPILRTTTGDKENGPVPRPKTLNGTVNRETYFFTYLAPCVTAA